MSFFNPLQLMAMFSGNYYCDECGARMEWEDEWEDILVCPECGFSIDSDHYGFESEEEYEALYPTKEEVMGYEDDEGDDDDEPVELYDEVHGELDDD